MNIAGLGAEMMVLTRNADAFRQKAPHLASRPDIRFHIGDVRDFAFPDGHFSHVIHAATETVTKPGEENPGLMLETIVAGTRRALEFAGALRREEIPIDKLRRGLWRAAGRLDPCSRGIRRRAGRFQRHCSIAYGEGKRLAELLCAIEGPRHGLETKIARCFAFVGPYLPLDAHFAIGNFIRDALAGGPISIKGDGTPFRSYLYAGDLAAWLWTILIRGAANRPYNVGSSQAVSILETAQAVARVVGGNIQINIAQKAKSGQPKQHYVPNINRAAGELELDQWTQLDDAIRATVAWHRLAR